MHSRMHAYIQRVFAIENLISNLLGLSQVCWIPREALPQGHGAAPLVGPLGSSGGSCQLPDPHLTLRAGNMCSKLNLETPDQYVKIVVVESDAQLNNHAQLDSVAMCALKSRDGSAQISYD